MSSPPHALVCTLPFVGHITPFIHLSHFLTNHDFTITFVNTEHNQHIVSSNNDFQSDQIRMISIPDGLSSEEERNSHKLFLALEKSMPARLEQVIREINEREEEKKITCLIADCHMAWAFEVAEKMGIQAVAFGPISGVQLAATFLSIPKLIKDGVVDENGVPRDQEKFRLTPTTPLMDPAQLIWNCLGDRNEQQIMFHYFTRFVYVSFGSVAKLNQNQFEELGLGLELSKMRFLWITRPDLTDANNHNFLRLFEERVKQQGKTAQWCNQKKVLAHPSIACFVSHCGWNSTMEGVKNGLRFLCWPYFCDQFANRDYICDVLKVGLPVVKNENGVVTKENIRSSLIELMENDEMKERAEKLKGIVNKSIVEGGSFKNLKNCVQAIKQ
ncbi:hypothetical protein LUZ60_001183 [Juncus effusus]|nr:hypothetical protein LUZ60_001183 [Juncus effusus]